MADPLPSENLTCTQCGGELHPDEGQLFITCPYCSASVYLDKSKVVFHWSLAPTLSEIRRPPGSGQMDVGKPDGERPG
ncbi:MAG: hypothetical protein AB9891_07845 [Anaerolineaceae bacterium]